MKRLKKVFFFSLFIFCALLVQSAKAEIITSPSINASACNSAGMYQNSAFACNSVDSPIAIGSGCQSQSQAATILLSSCASGKYDCDAGACIQTTAAIWETKTVNNEDYIVSNDAMNAVGVGIGSTVPDVLLTVGSGADDGNIIAVNGATGKYVGFKVSDASVEKWFMGHNEDNNFVVRNAPYNYLTINKATGDVYVSSTGNGNIYLKPKSYVKVEGAGVVVDNLLGYFWNSYWDGVPGQSGNFRLIKSGYAGFIQQGGTGGFSFYTSPSAGNAGDVPTMNRVMKINASGEVGIGVNSPSAKLEVAGTVSSTDIRAAVDVYTNGIKSKTNGFDNIWLGDSNDTIQIQGTSSIAKICLGTSGCKTDWSQVGSSQWTTTGNNISNNNSGNVGIKESDPKNALSVGGGGITIDSGQPYYWNGYYDSGHKYAKDGYAAFIIQKRSSGQINPGYMAFLMAPYGSANAIMTPVEVMTFSSSTYRVGIGSTNPGAKLDVNGQVMFGSGSEFVGSGQNLIYGNIDATSAGNLMLLQNEGTNKFMVTAAGKVGIGTTAPNTALAIKSDVGTPIGFNWGQISIEPVSDNQDVFINLKTTRTTTDRVWGIGAGSGGNPNNANFRIYDFTANADRLNIDTDGNVLIGVNSLISDAVREVDLLVASSTGSSRIAVVGNSASARAELNLATGIDTDGDRKTSNLATNGNGDFYIWMNKKASGEKNDGFIPFWINGGDGHIGIGTTNPQHYLTIVVDDNSRADTIEHQSAKPIVELYNPNGGDAAIAEFSARTGGGAWNESTRLGATGPGFVALTGQELWKQDAGYLVTGNNLSGGLSIGAVNSAGELRFYTGGFQDNANVNNRRMTITSGGNVGIGTNNPNAKLEVMGNTLIHGDVAIIKDNLNDATRMTLGGNGAQATWDYSSIYLKGNDTGDYTSGGTAHNDPYTHWGLSHRIGASVPGYGEEPDNALMLSFFKGGNNDVGGNYTAGIVITPNITPGQNVTSTVAINKASPPNKAYALDVVGSIYTDKNIDVAGVVKIGNTGVACGASLLGTIRYNTGTGTFEGCSWKNGYGWKPLN